MIALTSSVIRLFVTGSVIFSLGNAYGQEWTPQPEQVLEKGAEHSPYVGQHFPQRVFFGDNSKQPCSLIPANL